MLFWYKFLSYLFYPFSYFFLLFRKLKKKEDKDRYLEKIAKIKIKRKDGFLVWFHVASVGEAMSIGRSFTESLQKGFASLEYDLDGLDTPKNISSTKEMLLMKDTIEGIEEMADKCQEVSDSFILLALSL